MDHSSEQLLGYVTGGKGNLTRSTGPIPEFLAKKQAENAAKTHAWHTESLTQYWNFVEELGLTTVGDFTEQSVNLFRSHMKQRGLSDNTISNRLRSIRAFGNWMEDRGWTEENPLKGLKVPQSTKPHFELISDEDRSNLFSLFDPDTFLGSRNMAIVAILSDTGLRREEVVSVHLKNVDLDAQHVRLYSDKVKEWRYVPLTDVAVALIRNHLKWRERYFKKPTRARKNGSMDDRTKKPRTDETGLLFVAWNGKPLAPRALSLHLGRWSKKLGAHLHPHLFRHDWITRKALDGENPSVVKRWAGHKSFAMTDYYFDLAEEMLGAIKPKSSVLANITLPGKVMRGRRPKAGAPSS